MFADPESKSVSAMSSLAKRIRGRERFKHLLASVRALVRGNEFYLIPLGVVIGIVAGAAVTAMAEIAQIAHVLIFGIPVDVRLSAHSKIDPHVALVAPATGGLLLGMMEYLRRRWKISNAVDPIEASAARRAVVDARQRHRQRANLNFQWMRSVRWP